MTFCNFLVERKHFFIVWDFNVDTSSAIINPNITVNNF